MSAPAVSGPLDRTIAFFRRHPIALLLALTPGIPEYLSGSSPTTYLGELPAGPVVFLLFLALNLGLYGPGVLLVREAWIRRGRSWGALVLLGVAYALLEEGTALSTLFNPKDAVVQGIARYGRVGGVNGIWLIGVVGYHVVLSVGLPIVLLGLALPATRGRPLLTSRGRAVALGVFGADVVVLALVANYWRSSWPWMIGAAAVALALVGASRRFPTGRLDPPTVAPSLAPGAFFALGLALFPILILTPAFGGAARLPAWATGALELGLSGILFVVVRARIGRTAHDAQLTMLAFGVTLPVVVFGLLTQIRLPIVLGFDALYALFFGALWTAYRPRSNSGTTFPPGGGRAVPAGTGPPPAPTEP